jgi:hypothetical protein
MCWSSLFSHLLFDAVIRSMGDEPPTGPREVHLQTSPVLNPRLLDQGRLHPAEIGVLALPDRLKS